MLILGIVGSPRKEGRTNTLIDAALEGAAQGGAETQKLYLVDYAIKPFTGSGGAEQGSSYMGVAVVVVPCKFVLIGSVCGGDFFKSGVYVLFDKARFKFECCNSRGRSDVKENYTAVFNF